jgi:hypothetical protein
MSIHVQCIVFIPGVVEHTIKIGRAHKRDVHTEVSVVGGAIEAKVNAERNRRPGRVVLAAVKTYLRAVVHQ